jgi:hypothetical protein
MATVVLATSLRLYHPTTRSVGGTSCGRHHGRQPNATQHKRVVNKDRQLTLKTELVAPRKYLELLARYPPQALSLSAAPQMDASSQEPPVPHADLPRWQQAQQLGYDCCGINGCILAVRHQGECVFPEMSDRRRCQVIEPKPAEKEASLAHPKKKKSKKPPKTAVSAGSANAGTSGASTKRTPAPKPTPTPKPAAAPKPAPTPTPTPTGAAAAGDEEEPPAPDDVPCRKCGSRGGAKRMLLCDGEGGTCTAAYHTYCLTPPLLSLPKGDWFCPSCELKRQAGSGMSMRQQMRYLADLAEAPD